MLRSASKEALRIPVMSVWIPVVGVYSGRIGTVFLRCVPITRELSVIDDVFVVFQNHDSSRHDDGPTSRAE